MQRTRKEKSLREYFNVAVLGAARVYYRKTKNPRKPRTERGGNYIDVQKQNAYRAFITPSPTVGASICRNTLDESVHNSLSACVAIRGYDEGLPYGYRFFDRMYHGTVQYTADVKRKSDRPGRGGEGRVTDRDIFADNASVYDA